MNVPEECNTGFSSPPVSTWEHIRLNWIISLVDTKIQKGTPDW